MILLAECPFELTNFTFDVIHSFFGFFWFCLFLDFFKKFFCFTVYSLRYFDILFLLFLGASPSIPYWLQSVIPAISAEAGSK